MRKMSDGKMSGYLAMLMVVVFIVLLFFLLCALGIMFTIYCRVVALLDLLRMR
jgi:flagellar biosynthesis protein FliP